MTKEINVNFEKPKGSTSFMIILLLFISVGMFANYMYIPALPLIAHDLLASNGAVATTVTAALVGCGISQIFYGPISDSFGRKKNFINRLNHSMCRNYSSYHCPFIKSTYTSKVYHGN